MFSYNNLKVVLKAEAQAVQVPDVDKICCLQLWRLQRVVIYIEAHLAENMTLLELSKQAGFSPMHFAGQFRASTGMRPHEYILRRKVEEAQMLLITSNTSIVDLALNLGFLSQAHFTTVFKRFVGSPPSRWQHIRKRQIKSAMFRLRKLKREPLQAWLPQ